MSNELQTRDETVDLKNLTEAIGALINPLAEHQAATQIEQIRAADKQHERVTIEAGKENQRRFWVTLIAMVLISAMTLALLFVFGRPEPALYALTYLGGAISGYGYARAKPLRAGK